jgi:hypothetical protein
VLTRLKEDRETELERRTEAKSPVEDVEAAVLVDVLDQFVEVLEPAESIPSQLNTQSKPAATEHTIHWRSHTAFANKGNAIE